MGGTTSPTASTEAPRDSKTGQPVSLEDYRALFKRYQDLSLALQKGGYRVRESCDNRETSCKANNYWKIEIYDETNNKVVASGLSLPVFNKIPYTESEISSKFLGTTNALTAHVKFLEQFIRSKGPDRPMEFSN